MIDTIELNDWESHKHTILELSETVTVILGQSHNGKSSIVRAFDWVQNNRPVSTSYFPRGKKKPKSIVSILKDESFISRVRTKSKNYYETKDGEFKALRSGVPVQVTDFLGMTEINLQLQKDVHYMLTDTPGVRAKRLNDIAGLSEMDKAIDAVNSMHRSVQSEYNIKTETLNELEGEYKELDWVDKAQSDYQIIIDQQQSLFELRTGFIHIETALRKVLLIKKEMDKLPNVNAIPDIETIFDRDDELIKLEIIESNIVNRLNALSEVEKRLKDINLPDEEELTILDAKLAEFSSKKQQIKDINVMIRYIDSVDDDLVVSKGVVGRLMSKEKSFMEQFDVCPFCNQSMGEK